ncbi:bifunctional DNA-formamidopyrimidine glycosylase/DNA-(apurinic or apyrimidinic site) lyase [uncultured Desulfovibrio sp.]|uniref:bifunctional DNA-formamidopyrimidine glycosylase/DNA-(apurinic or apyrimidinic site) lyase n=1 Tax=uncultured Desulfovibrio sp. TaxID=167968 RepID=UPI002626898E|nr:bifunctional DNA-formamidopyrimidine glycosylase/DNA-(apurinic or apyrimidinic site) lyase [uncultured Desulfovibrio sp.]
MPELPEVETVVRTLRPQVQGCRITAVDVLRERSLHPSGLPPETLVGLGIGAVRRRGKLALLELEAPAAACAAAAPDAGQGGPRPSLLAVHLRMTGRFMVHAEGSAPLRHTRIIFHLRRPDGTGAQLFFDDVRAFGLVFIATPELLDGWDFWRSLGPEPLEMRPADLGPRLRGRRAVKALLLDQTVLAGVGNIYADESLFRAGIDPRRPAQSLTAAEAESLCLALQDVLRESIAQCGSSIRDYRDANGDVGAFQNSFFVYGRGGQACRRCGGRLEKHRVAGRGTVICPHCQH